MPCHECLPCFIGGDGDVEWCDRASHTQREQCRCGLWPVGKREHDTIPRSDECCHFLVDGVAAEESAIGSVVVAGEDENDGCDLSLDVPP